MFVTKVGGVAQTSGRYIDIAKRRALRPLRANDGTPGEKKRVCALQKNVEIRATWGS